MEVESRPFDIREMIEDVVSLVAAARPNLPACSRPR
jgi:hypothetical protein